MLIALPNCQGRVSPVFDVAARLVLVQLKGVAELERREVVLFEKQPEGIVRSLGELGIKVLICGAISQGLQLALEGAGVRVVPGICGELDPVIGAYRKGMLTQPEFALPGCHGPAQATARGAPDAEGAPVPAARKQRTTRKRNGRKEISCDI